jgi:hypothetical protein
MNLLGLQYAREGTMTAQEQYDSLDSQQKGELLLKIGQTSEQARLLGQRNYVALGGWVKTRLKRYWNRSRG